MIQEDRDGLTELVIGLAIDVHRALGPGLLESTYEACLSKELSDHGVKFGRQVAMPLTYKGETIDCAYRIDLKIEDKLLVELKSVDRIQPIHEAQLLTYMRLSGIKTGLLMNFNVRLLKNGLKRFVL
jgi:GxxExxY protein